MTLPSPAPSSPGSVRLSHRIEYAGLRAGMRIARLLPEPVCTLLGSGIGWLAGSVLRIRRKVVDENLRHAFPEMDPRRRRRIAAATYRHFGREAILSLHFAGVPAAELRARVDCEGDTAVLSSTASPQGFVLVTGHFGNWEVGGGGLAAHSARGIDGVVQTQSNPLFDAEWNRMRAALGFRTIPRQSAVREGLRSLRAGRTLALVADQDARDGGTFVPFFGRLASTARGPALLALRGGVPLVLMAVFRAPGRWKARYRLALQEIPIPEGVEGEERVREWTARFTAGLEEWIRIAPEQYFWFHRRWKTVPPSEAGTGGAEVEEDSEQGSLPDV